MFIFFFFIWAVCRLLMLHYLSALFYVVIFNFGITFIVLGFITGTLSILCLDRIIFKNKLVSTNKSDFVVRIVGLVSTNVFLSILLCCSVGFWLVQYSRWCSCPARLRLGFGLSVFFHWYRLLWAGMSLGVGCEFVTGFSSSRDCFIDLSWY